ncbi:MAG: transketolase [Planctomycetota bacterium]|nr:MAG: transketolase [Planctomycetota bacterium]
MNLHKPTFNVNKLRKTVLEMAYAGSTVHIGCAFSIIELLAVLYRNHLNYPNNDPESKMRDYLVLSKGHGVMAQYACMRELGWLKDNSFTEYFSNGSELKGLSDSLISGLEVTSGTLGHGFSVGVGMSLGAKLAGTNQKTYALVGDGEINEGAIWEGALFASHHELKNFMVIIDENGFQAMGTTKEVLNLNSIKNKFESFGFETITIDGHDEECIDQAINKLWSSSSNMPKAVVAKTIKGKGVSFMENNNEWHYTRLNEHTYNSALAEIEKGEQ